MRNLLSTANRSIELVPVALPTELLEQILRRHARDLKAEGRYVDQFYGHAARRIVESCTRLPVVDPAADPFLEVVGVEGLEWRYSARILSIAQSLWGLREIDGFDELCRRLRSADLRIAASELFAADLFRQAGFKVTVKPEVNELGRDFDFSATKGGALANVEVTTIRTESYRAKTLLNALKAEHEQLPADGPGVIAIDIPQSWYDNFAGNLNLQIRDDAERFILRCGRINMVVLLTQEFTQHASDPVRGTTGTLSFGFVALGNPNARNDNDALMAFFDKVTVPNLPSAPINEPALMYRQANSLFDWLDQFWYGDTNAT